MEPGKTEDASESPQDEPNPAPPAEGPSLHSRLADGALATLLVGGYLVPPIAYLVAILGSPLGGAVYIPLGLVGLGAVIYITYRAYRRIRLKGRGKALGAVDVLVLVLLPLWGLVYNFGIAHETCAVRECDEGSTVFRPLAAPEVWGLVALHVVTALAYVASRRRKEALQPAIAELSVHAAMIVGMLMHATLAVHFGKWTLLGFAIPPLFLPCAAPVFTVFLYGAELRHRLRLRGADARAQDLAREQPLYRAGPAQTVLPTTIHRPTLARALALSPALLGLHALLHAVWLGETFGALRVFTRTCDYTLSQLPIEIIPGDCHYLCTVAARGHSWLVRPLRMGRRGGVPIVVNRQLAVANAFEDLLHERWPRFGRLARRTYDLLARPVCRYLRPRWASDLVYLLMKPAEWVFYLTLVLLDPRSPERRIDRMYR